MVHYLREDKTMVRTVFAKDGLHVGMKFLPGAFNKGFFTELSNRAEEINGKSVNIYTFKRNSDGLCFEVTDGKVSLMGSSVKLTQILNTIKSFSTSVLNLISGKSLSKRASEISDGISNRVETVLSIQ